MQTGGQPEAQGSSRLSQGTGFQVGDVSNPRKVVGHNVCVCVFRCLSVLYVCVLVYWCVCVCVNVLSLYHLMETLPNERHCWVDFFFWTRSKKSSQNAFKTSLVTNKNKNSINLNGHDAPGRPPKNKHVFTEKKIFFLLLDVKLCFFLRSKNIFKSVFFEVLTERR